MKVRFLGPVGKVTGSCTWLWDEKRRWNLLVDCGMQQGEPTAAKWNRGDWPFDPADIQCVVLTHAHIDHCGLLPLLYKRGFKGRVHCAKETRQIATLLLKDAAKLSDLYTKEDVDLIQWHEPGNGQFFGMFHPLAQDLFVRFYRSGHVLGAVSAAIYWGEPKSQDQRSIVFSGDIGPNVEDEETLPFLRHRMGVSKCDYAVIESTYGGKTRPAEESDPASRRARLRQLVDQAIDSGGVLAIPAFSLGRTQDVLFDLHWIVAENPERYGALPVYLDSPTARKIHRVMLEALARTESNGRNGKVRPLWLGKQMFRWFGLDDRHVEHVQRVMDICHVTLGHDPGSPASEGSLGNALAQGWRPIVQAPADREEIYGSIGKGPAILVVSSGTGDGGPAAYWLPKLLGRDNTIVALAGFCSPATIGGQLLAMAHLAPGERERLSETLSWPPNVSIAQREVRARITMLAGYSAHADQAGLLAWVFDCRGRAADQVFIQHGTDTNRAALRAAIEAHPGADGGRVKGMLPDADAVFDLDDGGRAIQPEEDLDDLEREIARLQERRRRLRRG